MPSASRPSRRSPSRPWIGPVIGVVVVLTAVGGLLARNIYQTPAAPPPAAAAAPPATTVSAGASFRQPGSPVVQLSVDASAMPYSSTVQQTLQQFYDAINAHDYNEWSRVVTPRLLQQQQAKAWLNSFGTTQDGNMYVYRIDAAPDGLRVLLSFTSIQSLASAPSYAPYTCINWHVVQPMVRNGNGWQVDSGSNSQNPLATQCPSS